MFLRQHSYRGSQRTECGCRYSPGGLVCFHMASMHVEGARLARLKYSVSETRNHLITQAYTTPLSKSIVCIPKAVSCCTIAAFGDTAIKYE